MGRKESNQIKQTKQSNQLSSPKRWLQKWNGHNAQQNIEQLQTPTI